MISFVLILIMGLFYNPNINKASAQDVICQDLFMNESPDLLKIFSLEHGNFPNFAKVKTDDFLPSLELSIANTKSKIEIIKQNNKPNFDNTILALEDAFVEFNRVYNIFDTYSHSFSNDEIKKIEQTVAQQTSAFMVDVYSDVDLFEKVNKVYQNRAVLSDDQKRLVEKFNLGFISSGSNLKGKDKERFKKIDEELAALRVKFSQNVQEYTKDFKLVVKNKSELQGLSQSTIEALKNVNDGYVVTLEPSLVVEILEKADNEALRKSVYLAYNKRSYHSGKTDNSKIIYQIAELKQEQAQLLGFKDFASFVIDDRMAKSPQNVMDFTNKLIKAYLPYAEKEDAELSQYVKAKTGSAQYSPWDRPYWAQKQLQEKFAFDDEKLKEYFVYENVQGAVFKLAKKFYGIEFIKRDDLPKPHADVTIYEVRDSKNEIIAYLMIDVYSRLDGKKNGAWMSAITPTYMKNSQRVPTFVTVNMNYSRQPKGQPLLLKVDEASTLFHEFGHALHGILSRARYSEQAGTNVKWDFVELPSQFMENFLYEKEVLDLFAFHYKTGAPLPKELLDSLLKEQRYRIANFALRQFGFILLDMAWHTGEFMKQTGSISEIERRVLEPVTIFKNSEDISISTSFSHIFGGGYSAAYYSYMWARVLDSDAFAIFKKEGLLNTDTAQRFLHNVLEVGDTIDPMDAYVRFAGRPPEVESMLRRDGLN